MSVDKVHADESKVRIEEGLIIEQLLAYLKKDLGEAQEILRNLEIQMDEDDESFDADNYNYWRGYIASLEMTIGKMSRDDDTTLHEGTEKEFKEGVLVKHYRYGLGIILGNYHKRGNEWFWHIAYKNGTFGYNSENCLKVQDKKTTLDLDGILR